MTDFYKAYEKSLYKKCLMKKYDDKCENVCPSVVILTFSIVDAAVAEVNVAGPLTCSVPPEGSPAAPFIQCLILQGFEIIAFTQGGLDNNFVTYTFVNC